MPTTILLVDDHALFRKGLRLLLNEEQDFKVIGEAGDGQEAIDMAGELSPDVIVMDINMPNFNGIDATRQIVNDFPGVRIVALSINSGKRYIEDMLRAGAAGYILKECVPEELVRGVRTVMGGETYLSPAVVGIVVSEFVQARPIDQTPAEQDEGTAAVHPIIATKLHRPRIPTDCVHRSRLIKKLEKGRGGLLTLVTAPAGYGKSILLSSWLEGCGCPNAWVSLDESDNDLRQFLVYFINAIQTMFPHALEKALALANAGSLPPVGVLAARLSDEINLIDQDFILAMDDIHLVHIGPVFEMLSELMKLSTHHMHLALAGRRDPFLPVSTLRVRGALTEIRISDLSFTEKEVGAYLKQVMGYDIEETTIVQWTEKTEGWVAGVRLAALAMGRQGDFNRLLQEMEGGPQYVTEYLFSEVLSKQDADIRHYLLCTSILDRFCGPLCDALVQGDTKRDEQESNGWNFVNVLKEENLFTISLDVDNYWYRYHHLFRQLLQNQLKRYRSAKELAALHSRASGWLEANGLVTEAIHHALAAGDVDGAAQLVEKHRQAALNNDQWYLFEKWLDLFPEAFIQKTPELQMAKIWIHYHHFNILAIAPAIDAVELLLGDAPMKETLRGEIDFFRGYFCYFQNDGIQSLKHFENALKRIPEAYLEIRGQIEILHGLASQMEGQKEKAVTALNKVLYHHRLPDSVRKTRLLVTLVYIHIISGELNEALWANKQFRKVSVKGKFFYAEAWSTYLDGLIYFYQNEFHKAADLFLRALENGYILHSRALADSIAGLTLIAQATGQFDQIRETIQRVLSDVDYLDEPAYRMITDACQARVSMMGGNPQKAIAWCSAPPPPVENMVWWLEIPVVTYCRALLAEGSDASIRDAEMKLRELLQLNQKNHNICYTIHILPLLALACQKQGQTEESLAILEQAIDLAQPGGWIWPFFECGDPMADLLKELLKKKVAVNFIERILAAIDGKRGAKVPDGDDSHVSPANSMSPSFRPHLSPSPEPHPLAEPLTNREVEILELLAQRLQNKEIADKLFISTQTVKTHLTNIYGKLGVGKRRKAVEKAKELGLVSCQ